MAGIKFGFKVVIVEKYERLFDSGFYDTLEKDGKEASDYWNEFFLLKVGFMVYNFVLFVSMIAYRVGQLKSSSKYSTITSRKLTATFF